jgi:hypothetical protein
MTQPPESVRCPVCNEQASSIQYGMPAGPPEPGVVLGGCAISPDNPDFLCQACKATWKVRRDGSIQLIDSGGP